jgi:hypothetical protein
MEESLSREAHAKLMFEQRDAQIGHLPVQILLDLARNEAASKEWRKAAVQFLMDKHATQANHPDLATLRLEIATEHTAKQDVQDMVETAIEGELFPEPTPFAAGVTTANLQRDEAVNNIVRNPDALGDDALND